MQIKPELRPSLNEILNHPFLRNGGPLQRFSTAHGLRGSTSVPQVTTKSPPPAATSTTGSRAVVTQKYVNPDRGGLKRPPLTTRVPNVDAAKQKENFREGKPSRAVVGLAGACACLFNKLHIITQLGPETSLSILISFSDTNTCILHCIFFVSPKSNVLFYCCGLSRRKVPVEMANMALAGLQTAVRGKPRLLLRSQQGLPHLLLAGREALQ